LLLIFSVQFLLKLQCSNDFVFIFIELRMKEVPGWRRVFMHYFLFYWVIFWLYILIVAMMGWMIWVM